jgi:molybdopterin converting factor small subunit
MQVYTRNQEVVHASGRNVRQLINELDEAYPGLKGALMNDDKLRPDIVVAVDGKITRLGLLQPLTDVNEVIFLPAMSGG